MLGFLKGVGWKWYLIGGLAVAAAFAAWQWENEIRDAARYATIGAQLESDLAAAEEQLAEERAERRRLERLAAERADELAALRERDRTLRDDLRRLEDENEDFRRWADGRLPDDLVERLHELGSGADHPDGD